MRKFMLIGICAFSLIAEVAMSQTKREGARPNAPEYIAMTPNFPTTAASTAFAGASELPKGGHDLEITGDPTANGLMLSMNLGRLFRQGAKVYSEPSHTLIFAGMSPQLNASKEGEDLRSKAIIGGGGVVVTDFPNAAVRIEVPARPPDDYGIVVYAVTGSGDFLVAAGKVGGGRFGWKTTWAELNGVLDPTHCCSNACGEVCIDCSGPYFTCCLQCGCQCYNIECGWIWCINCGSCSKADDSAGAVPCPGVRSVSGAT